ncbi:hypothetical protein DTO021D3_5522 [Paecilomyces variotii]|nr:hypothetical protein DTO032I3_8453 [Paecilomyces variotii]KAJ9277688.1 hypothetical protein DTO021D3_5522 [Paecilomyces variotii]KAJ9341948.1 hypothetical protein DTO027B6_5598 [Paecilomyces variotii]KAJ9389334.1 hypothetical protein DTO032I4_2359 [Paecilomyces variotii]
MYQKESAGILLTSRYILQKIISQDLTYYLILLALFGRGEHRGCAATEDEQIVMPQNVIHVSTGAHLSIEAPRLDRRQPRAVRIGKKKKEAKKKIKSSLKTEQGLKIIGQDVAYYLVWLALFGEKNHCLQVRYRRGGAIVGEPFGGSDIALERGQMLMSDNRRMVTLKGRSSGMVAIYSFDYKEISGIREDQGGEGPFDLLIHGVTAIGKALLGQASWDSAEVWAELYFVLAQDEQSVKLFLQDQRRQLAKRLEEAASREEEEEAAREVYEPFSAHSRSTIVVEYLNVKDMDWAVGLIYEDVNTDDDTSGLYLVVTGLSTMHSKRIRYEDEDIMLSAMPSQIRWCLNHLSRCAKNRRKRSQRTFHLFRSKRIY